MAEAAVVGRPDDLKGQAIVAFVTLEGGFTPGKDMEEELRAHVAKEIGSIADTTTLEDFSVLERLRVEEE